MDGLNTQEASLPIAGRPSRWLTHGVALLLVLASAVTSLADEHLEGFEDEQPSWSLRQSDRTLEKDSQQTRLTNSKLAYRGNGVEQLVFRTTSGPTQLVLDHKLPVAQAIDDLKLKLHVRATGGAVRIGLRVVFPRQNDPRTPAKQLKTVLYGDSYTKVGSWQELKVGTSIKALQEEKRRLRAELRPTTLDLDQAVVDRVVLELSLDSGKTELLVDELRFGPFVKPVANGNIQLAQNAEDVARWPVSFQLDRLSVDGKPFFLRMLPYHGERVEDLRDAGFNVIWIPEAGDVDLQRSLKQQGLWAIAAPPQLRGSTGNTLSNESAGLLPIPRDRDNLLAWNLGVAVSPESQRSVLQWISQVKSADRERHRPIMIDVTGGERIYSRNTEMLGTSRHMFNSTMSFKTYRESLDQHRKLARPGTFLFTWLPTEPMPDVALQRKAAGRIPIIIEPEQIFLGAHSALAAGCRGLGFSLSESLDAKTPGASERRLAIGLLNLELSLLEDFLAAGTLVEQRPFEITAPSGSGIKSHDVAFRNSAISRADKDARLAAHKSGLLREARIRSELEAAVFRTDKATLLLPIWYEDDAQFVPGQLAAPGATIDVASVPETAFAYEVTTTRIAPLNSEPIPGGRRVKLPAFDTTAAIIVTSDPSVIADLKRKMETMQAQSARNWIELAKAKLNRVRIADDELTKLGAGQPDAPQLLAQARGMIQKAEGIFPGDALERAIAQAREAGQRKSPNSADVVQLRKRFDEAARYSQTAMQSLRILQKAHWETATHRLKSPVGSPHTLCFQTLPDHWRLIAMLGKSTTRASENLLTKGDFEVLDYPTLSRFGWQTVPTTLPTGVRAAVQVLTATGRDSRCLRLVAAPDTNNDPPNMLDVAPLTLTAPAIAVRAGQVLHISGWVRVASAVTGSFDGVTLSDNLTGRSGAWHWQEKREWQRFEMLREAYQDGPFALTITLHGLGDVQFDDLEVISHDPPGESQLATHSETATEPESKAGRFDFLKRFPKLPQLPK
ncbi:hypothetical protein LBMAG52_29800 [Planctomycetia bacterium]|nr:hypothetical protein LBMAG52_29800 [Planctomycetia bacterium]